MGVERAGKAVFHFIGVASGDQALTIVKGGLLLEPGAV